MPIALVVADSKNLNNYWFFHIYLLWLTKFVIISYKNNEQPLPENIRQTIKLIRQSFKNDLSVVLTMPELFPDARKSFRAWRRDLRLKHCRVMVRTSAKLRPKGGIAKRTAV